MATYHLAGEELHYHLNDAPIDPADQEYMRCYLGHDVYNMICCGHDIAEGIDAGCLAAAYDTYCHRHRNEYRDNPCTLFATPQVARLISPAAHLYVSKQKGVLFDGYLAFVINTQSLPLVHVGNLVSQRPPINLVITLHPVVDPFRFGSLVSASAPL